MLRLAAWTIPVVREILTGWALQDLGGETPITVTTERGTHPNGHRRGGFLELVNRGPAQTPPGGHSLLGRGLPPQVLPNSEKRTGPLKLSPSGVLAV